MGISLNTTSPDGWKTADLDAYPAPYTGQHYEDDAVYLDFDGVWKELRYPSRDLQRPGESMDLAFVITPEPSTMVMLAVGALTLTVGWWRRRRKA